MGIDSHCRPVPHHGEHHVCSFAPYARYLHQIVDIVGDFAVEVLYNRSGCPYQ
jgi:hypothetical protein